ncbi:hypothetical protein D5R81_07065 [Parashewanella spongiae]|uniref:Porin n=1 Tax=Parashewanella spongiae TaxID=342950 RepID=A0A3A6UGL7_9GAMM|nr:hypothetical protein [Parashewanella spongiae]MCL1077734.1 hypothetical protein [Parashewanella spongiae]RJY18064.1 hypothetical protein D5R81_07065 [Parashewanella spongiae]
MTNKLTHTKFPIKTTLAALSLMFVSANSMAGAWVGEKGTGYTKIGFSTYEANGYRGNNPSFDNFESNSISFYGEYGLGNSFSLFGSLLHQSYDQVDTVLGKSSSSGLGDVELGLRYQWQADPFVLSTSFLVKSPFLYDADDGLGNNQTDYEAKILLGKGLDKFGYVGAEFGYRLRTGEPSDEYRYLLEYGFSVNENLYFRTKLDGILSANNSDVAPGSLSGNLSNPFEFDSGKLEFTTGWNFDKSTALKGFGLEVTYTREIYGENILEGNTIQLGLTKVF